MLLNLLKICCLWSLPWTQAFKRNGMSSASFLCLCVCKSNRLVSHNLDIVDRRYISTLCKADALRFFTAFVAGITMSALLQCIPLTLHHTGQEKVSWLTGTRHNRIAIKHWLWSEIMLTTGSGYFPLYDIHNNVTPLFLAANTTAAALSDKPLQHNTANREHGAQLDTVADDYLYGNRQCTLFDVRVFNPFAPESCRWISLQCHDWTGVHEWESQCLVSCCVLYLATHKHSNNMQYTYTHALTLENAMNILCWGLFLHECLVWLCPAVELVREDSVFCRCLFLRDNSLHCMLMF